MAAGMAAIFFVFFEVIAHMPTPEGCNYFRSTCTDLVRLPSEVRAYCNRGETVPIDTLSPRSDHALTTLSCRTRSKKISLENQVSLPDFHLEIRLYVIVQT